MKDRNRSAIIFNISSSFCDMNDICIISILHR